MAQILAGWGPILREVVVVPGSGGVFDVDVDDERIWSKKAQQFPRYPDPQDVLPLLIDRIGPPVL